MKRAAVDPSLAQALAELEEAKQEIAGLTRALRVHARIDELRKLDARGFVTLNMEERLIEPGRTGAVYATSSITMLPRQIRTKGMRGFWLEDVKGSMCSINVGSWGCAAEFFEDADRLPELDFRVLHAGATFIMNATNRTREARVFTATVYGLDLTERGGSIA